MKNNVTIKNGFVVKTFSSRLDYLVESGIYKKLSGTGLAPRLIEARDGSIEHEYVEGDNFFDRLTEAEGSGNAAEEEKCLELFCSWYTGFRDLTRLTLGDIRFDKFILTGSGLCCIDFENCKPGYAEKDFASLCAKICFYEGPVSDSSLGTACRLLRFCGKRLELSSDMLALNLPAELKSAAQRQGFDILPRDTEYISTLLTCCGAVISGGTVPLESLTAFTGRLPQQLVSAPKPSPVENLIGLLENAEQPWVIVLSTYSSLEITEELWKKLMSTEKDELAAVVVEFSGKVYDFPLLISPDRALTDLKLARDRGETSVLRAISRLKVKKIRKV